MTRYLSVLFVVVFVYLGWLGDAQAYINPGKGSVLQQLLVGGFGGFVIVVKALLRKIFAFFGRK
jgi:hypothetical protein